MLRGVWLVVMAAIWSCEESRVGGLVVWYIVDTYLYHALM